MSSTLIREWTFLTWRHIMEEESIQFVQHPVRNDYVDKQEFYDEFQVVLNDMGTKNDKFVNYYFDRDTISGNMILFHNSFVKQQFLERVLFHCQSSKKTKKQSKKPTLSAKEKELFDLAQELKEMIFDLSQIRNEAVRIHQVQRIETIQTKIAAKKLR